MSTPARPDLKFDTLDAVLADADRLRGGYEKAGQWDLGMVLDHLSKAMSGPWATGQKNLPAPLAAAARVVVRGMVRRGRYPTWVTFPAPALIRPTPGVDADAARATLGATVDRLRPLPAGPLNCPPFGPLDKSDFVGLQLLHAAHHLSFLRPTGG